MRNRTIAALLVPAICLVMIALPGTAVSQGNENTNQALKTVIMNRLQKHGLLKDNDIRVFVADTSITLDGTVATLHQKGQVEHDAGEVAGGYLLIDNLGVKPVNITDKDLMAKVTRQLQNNVFYSIFDWVTLDVSGGKVTLAGWVYEPWHKRQFEHQVDRVPGVIAVDNRIKIESGSFYDDDIRFKAARLIYDDPFYDAYSSMPGAPIHIVVNEGDVTLYGLVSNSFQKNWAKNAIYSNTGAFNVYNNLQIEGKIG